MWSYYCTAYICFTSKRWWWFYAFELNVPSPPPPPPPGVLLIIKCSTCCAAMKWLKVFIVFHASNWHIRCPTDIVHIYRKLCMLYSGIEFLLTYMCSLCKMCILYGFPCEMDFSPLVSKSHSSSLWWGCDSEMSGEKSISYGKPYKKHFLAYFTLHGALITVKSWRSFYKLIWSVLIASVFDIISDIVLWWTPLTIWLTDILLILNTSLWNASQFCV